MQTPSPEIATVNTVTPAETIKQIPSTRAVTAQRPDQYNGTMRWTRRDGLTITPEKSANWKCVGGFYFTMKKDANGTTVIEGVMSNRKPVRC